MTQINPAHYKGNGEIQAIDVIEQFDLSFALGNVIKYVLRASKKGDRMTDLRKADWYLKREIQNSYLNSRSHEDEDICPTQDYL